MAQVTADALRVEVGLGSTWSTPLASITWTDVTSSVMIGSQGITFSRGKTSTDTVARPGTLSLTLDNSKQAGTEGRFTPGGTNQLSGWGLRIPIRVRAKYPLGGASYVDLWYGFIESMEVGWDAGYRATVRISASDRLARLERRSMQSLILGEQLVDGAIAAWPLDDAVNSTTAQDRSGSASVGTLNYSTYGTVTGSALLTFGSTNNLAPGPDGLTSANFAPQSTTIGRYLNTQAAWWADSSGGFPTTGTFELFVNPAASGTLRGLAGWGNPSGATGLFLYLDTSNRVVLTGGWWAGVNPGSVTSSSTVAGTWYHVAVTWTTSAGNTTFTLYLNGTSQGSTTPTGWLPQMVQIDVGVNQGAISPTVMNGSIANVAAYNTALSAATILDHANARTSYLGEAASARFNRAAAASGLSATEYAITGTTSSLMSEQPFNGRTLFDIEKEVAEAEAGALFLSRSGVLTLQARSNRYNPTSQFTLTNAIIDADSGFVNDMQLIVNDVTVQRKGASDGAAVRVTNAASIAAYDAHTSSVDMYVSTDAQTADAAAWLANVNATPQPRLTDVSVDLVTSASTLGSTTVTAVLSAEVGQMFTVSGLPSASTPSSTLSLIVEGVSDSITATSWKRTFVATSLTASLANVWQLDSSTYSVLGTSTRLAF